MDKKMLTNKQKKALILMRMKPKSPDMKSPPKLR